MATISLPEGLTPTKKDDGKVCVVVEGKLVDGTIEVSEMMSMEDYHKDKPEMKKEMAKKDMPMKGKKKRSARIAAILGPDEEGGGY